MNFSFFNPTHSPAELRAGGSQGADRAAFVWLCRPPQPPRPPRSPAGSTGLEQTPRATRASFPDTQREMKPPNSPAQLHCPSSHTGKGFFLLGTGSRCAAMVTKPWKHQHHAPVSCRDICLAVSGQSLRRRKHGRNVLVKARPAKNTARAWQS